MKAFYVIAVLLVLGAIYLFMAGDAEAPVIEDQVTSTNSEEMVVGQAMPAYPGAEVEEMVVEPVEDPGDEVSAAPDDRSGDLPEIEDVVLVQSFTIDSFSYGYSESEIRVKEGTTVTINLINSGGFHDWVVDEFNAATDKIQADGNTSVTFVADKAGTYEYYCSVGSHREQGMVGTLVVE